MKSNESPPLRSSRLRFELASLIFPMSYDDIMLVYPVLASAIGTGESEFRVLIIGSLSFRALVPYEIVADSPA